MKYYYVLIFALFIQHQLQACSAFYAKDKNNIYVGINVDWKVPDSQIHFFPPANNKYGYLNFNIRGYFDNSFGDTGGIMITDYFMNGQIIYIRKISAFMYPVLLTTMVILWI
jgi:hypothetical protein